MWRERRRFTCGELWWIDLDPVIGQEQGGRRPALIVSRNEFHDAAPGLVIVLPITTRERGYESHVRLPAGTGGLSQTSFVLAEQVRAVSTRRVLQRIGQVERTTVDQILDHLRFILDI